MDGVDETSAKARLFQVTLQGDGTLQPEIIARGALAQVNAQCTQQQKSLLAQTIQDGKIDALICVSCHVGIFRDTLRQAAARGVVVTGSGGTSLGQMAALYGIRLAGNAGGSVATTSLTKAVSYAHALAVAWNKSYEPWRITTGQQASEDAPSSTSVLNACLPAFWGVCITKRILVAALVAIGYLEHAPTVMDWLLVSLKEMIVSLERHTLPTVCAVVMALSRRRKGRCNFRIFRYHGVSSGIGQLSWFHFDGLVGWVFSVDLVGPPLVQMHLYQYSSHHDELDRRGGLGGVVALLVLPVAEAMRHTMAWFRSSLFIVLQSQPWGVILAFVLGCISCYGSKVGWYHSIHLPLILIEMESGDASFFGAMDELTLVLVCAGTCAAVLLSNLGTRRESVPADLLVCRRGLAVNLSCGEFVEVCYPYMDVSRLVNVGGYLASGLACAWLVWRGQEQDDNDAQHLPASGAYLPWPAAVLIAGSQYQAMLEASLVGFLVALFCLHLLLVASTTRQAKRPFGRKTGVNPKPVVVWSHLL